MRRTSKFYNLKSGDWTCTHVGVASVQPKLCLRKRVNGKLAQSKHPGSQQYYYIFERLTSDEKAMKMVRLSASQAKQVLDGVRTVEYFAQKKQSERSRKFTEKVSYSFN